MSQELDIKIANLRGFDHHYVDDDNNLHFKNPEGGHINQSLWSWSKHIEAAWTLFEEIKWYPFIKKICDDYYEIVFDKTENGYGVESIAGKTAPEAICNAWLKWKENEK